MSAVACALLPCSWGTEKSVGGQNLQAPIGASGPAVTNQGTEEVPVTEHHPTDGSLEAHGKGPSSPGPTHRLCY